MSNKSSNVVVTVDFAGLPAQALQAEVTWEGALGNSHAVGNLACEIRRQLIDRLERLITEEHILSVSPEAQKVARYHEMKVGLVCMFDGHNASGGPFRTSRFNRDRFEEILRDRAQIERECGFVDGWSTEKVYRKLLEETEPR